MRYIALLRAINVGGHVVKMERLRRLFEDIGLSDVETHIASGNVIFESAARSASSLEKRIAKQLEQALGYDVATFVRTTAELAHVARFEPFPPGTPAASPKVLYIGFLAQYPEADVVKAVGAFSSPVDDFLVHGREIYWACRVRSSDSAFSLARLERAIRAQATFRNVTTIRRLAALYPPA